jgi:hypothetical protein
MLFGAEQTNKDQQAFVPPLEKSGQPRRGLSALGHRDLGRMVQFDPGLISAEDYDEYMTFVESIWGYQGRGLLQNRFNMDQALRILHEANYNLARAKFYIQFPVLYQVEVHSRGEDEGSPP